MEEKFTNQNDQNSQNTASAQINSSNGQSKQTLSWSQPTQILQTNTQNQTPQNQVRQNQEKKKKNNQPMQQNKSNQPSVSSAATPTQSGWKTGGIIVGIVALCVFAVWGMVALRHRSEEVASITDSSAVMTEDDAEVIKTTTTIPTSSTAAPVMPSGTTLPIAVASPQAAGMKVAVSGVSVLVPTWFVVYQNNAGLQGGALGAGLFLPGSTSESIPLLRATEAGKSYFVGESVDDGDRVFVLHGDPQTKDADGKVLLTAFQVK